MKITWCRVFVGIAMTLFFACDDSTDTLGNSLNNDADQFETITDTFTVTTRSVVVDSVLAQSLYSYLGHIKDTETGTYITSHFMTQFSVLESLDGSTLFPEKDNIKSLDSNGEVMADSCKLMLYFYSSVGDSLNPMRLTVYEMGEPMTEDTLYYTNYNPEKHLRKDANAIKTNKVYTTLDLGLKDSLRYLIVDKTNLESVTIPLNDTYVGTDGRQYSNYGTYIMSQYYENPNNFRNSYNFIHNVCPGFYVKSTDGIGVMSEVYLAELDVFYRYSEEDSLYNGTLLLSGTEEVLRTTNITNDHEAMEKLASDSTCTYLKTPAGIFTEVTLPIEDIMQGHEKDNISSAKIEFNRMNSSDPDNAYLVPTYVMMLPKDSLFTFFEEKNLPDSKISFVGSYSSSYGTYSFNNISTLLTYMYENKQNGTASEDWNKVILVPVTITYSSTSSSTNITNVTNDMTLHSTRLVGGLENPRSPIKISIIYSKSIKD